MTGLVTYQDFLEAKEKDGLVEFISSAIDSYKRGDDYKTALIADEYDRQMNTTIVNYSRTLYSLTGTKVEDYTASNNKLCSNFFNRLNTQRCEYSLGNGISFVGADEGGKDTTKERLGKHFDHDVKQAGYYALIHGKSYLFWDLDRIHVFKVTEFVPLVDESTGELRAGIRWWQIDQSKPMIAVLYEVDGFTKYKTKKDGGLDESQPKRAYVQRFQKTDADDTAELLGEDNYDSLPIVTMYGSRLKQSTIVGMRPLIDSYDLVCSGFANNMTDCAEIYWIVNNAGGMEDQDLMRFRDRLKLQHIATVDGSEGASVVPYTQSVPHESSEALLDRLQNDLYRNFGALDVHTVSASSTNDHIDAAYQPMDENASDFESWVSEAIVNLLALLGIDDEPVFSRNRISNQLEQVQIVAQEAQWLDHETTLRKLPNITPEEVQAVLDRSEEENMRRFASMQQQRQEEDDESE